MKIKLILLLLVLLSFGLIGQSLAADEPVKITGLHIRGDTEQKISYIEGKVRLVQGSTVITTDRATVYTDKKQVFLEFKVRLHNSDGTVTADTLEYDFRQKSGTFRGNVILKRNASVDKKTKRKREPFTLRAAELFLETETKNFTATKCRFTHKDFNGVADQIFYDDSSEEMTLLGRVDLKRPKGEALQGEEIRIGLKDKSFTTSNKVNVQLEVDDDQPAKAEREPVNATGNSIRGDTDQKITYLEGNVRITQGSTVITTDKATIYNDQRKQAVLERNIKLENEDGIVTADNLNYDLRKKSGTFQGNVVMQRNANRVSSKKARKDPFTLHCDQLFLETKTENFTAVRGVFTHKDFSGSADQLIYRDSVEELIFRGHVDLKKTKGDTIRGEETHIFLKDKSFVATTKVNIEIEIDADQPEPKNPKSTSTPKQETEKGKKP